MAAQLVFVGWSLFSWSVYFTNGNVFRKEHDPYADLLRDLFMNHDTRIRPVFNRSDAIRITLTMTLYQLVEVNEPEEHLSVNLWMVHQWEDDYLAWNTSAYDGIDYVVVPWYNVWISDIVLYNGLDMSPATSERRLNAELQMLPEDPTRAHIRYAFPALYRFSCQLDVYYFPFDRQNCTMIFGSWVYDTYSVDLSPHDSLVKMDNFNPNQEWDIISFEAYKHVLNYSCCPNPYTNVQYHLVMQRKPLVFVCDFILPTVIVAMVAMLGFFVPSNTFGEREEKINLGIATLLAMSILLLMVADKIPTGGNYIPMMARFFLANIVIVAMATCMTTVVIIIQRQARYGRRVSPQMKKLFFNTVAAVLPVATPYAMEMFKRASIMSPQLSPTRKHVLSPQSYKNPHMRRWSRMADKLSEFEDIDRELGIANGNCNTCVVSEKTRLKPKPSLPLNLPPVHLAPSEMDKHKLAPRKSLTSPQPSKLAVDEWEMLADVVERLFFVIFVFALSALLTVTMFHAYRFI